MSEVFSVFVSSFILMTSVIVFGKIVFNYEIRYSRALKKILLVLLMSAVLHTMIYIELDGTIKTAILCLLYMMTHKILFRVKIGNAIISAIIYLVVLVIPDLLTLLTALYVFKIDKEIFYSTMAGGVIGNLVVSLLMIWLTYLIRKPLRKIINVNISINKNILITLIITFTFVAFFFYKFAAAYRIDQNVIVYLIAMVAFGGSLFSLLKQKMDNDRIAKKYDELLDIMKNYESDIEEQRVLIHEAKNELTTIRCKIKDREKENEIIEYIDSIVGDKVSSNMSRFSKFKYLPSNGLRGFFYYKVAEAERKGIDVSVSISNQIENSFLGKLDIKNFKDLVRIIGVYIDNAIEASAISSGKKLGIEIYLIKDSIDIIISNTYSNDIDEDKIGKERYSTKGKNRGHGLLLVKRILNDSKFITSKKEITKELYIQKVRIKNCENKKDQ